MKVLLVAMEMGETNGGKGRDAFGWVPTARKGRERP